MDIANGVKRSFVAGLILVAPLVVTVYVLQILVRWSLRVIDPVVASAGLTQYTGNEQVAAQALAAVLVVSAIAALGFLAEKSIGRHLFGNVGRVVNFIPLVNTIYSSVRQVATSLVDRDSKYDSVVLVEYPREGVYSIGLVTGESPPAMGAVADEPVHNVFLPNSPNPTAGRLVLVPESQVHEVDVSVRQGMRLIVTTGMTPEDDAAAHPELREEVPAVTAERTDASE